ncbi:MAG TPA: iron-containing alcohol dehydrogenase, partial [Geopsychrobacteraceae bacterium]
IAFSNAILGATHAMTHQVDGLLDHHHGETNAAILPHVMEFNLSANPEKFAIIAEALGKEIGGLAPAAAAALAIEAVNEILEDIGLAKGLAAFGIKKGMIRALSKNALNDACLVTNPREASLADIEAIFRRAL